MFCSRFLSCIHSHLWNGDLELRGEDQAGDSSLVWVWMLLPMETVKLEKKSGLRIEPWALHAWEVRKRRRNLERD